MKKFFTILLTCALICGFASPAWAGQIPEFNDLAGLSQTAKKAIMKLAVLGVLEGDKGEGGAFRPHATLTRAEFAKIVCYLTGKATEAESLQNATSRFNDVSNDKWYSGYVEAAAGGRFINCFKGDPDGNFRPDDEINLNELVTVALRCVGYTDKLGSGSGNTVWPDNYITKAKELGLLDSVNFVGSNPATRVQAAIICEAVLGIGMVEWIDPYLLYTLALWINPDYVDQDSFSILVDVYYRKSGESFIIRYNILHNFFRCYSVKSALFLTEDDYQEIALEDRVAIEKGELPVKFNILDLVFYITYRDKNREPLEPTTLLLPMKMAEKYYITNGLTIDDLPGREAQIIYNNKDELVFVDVL